MSAEIRALEPFDWFPESEEEAAILAEWIEALRDTDRDRELDEDAPS